MGPFMAAAGAAGGAGALPKPGTAQNIGAQSVAGLAGLIQGVTGAFRTKQEKENDEALAALEALKRKGLLGFSPEYERLRQQQLLDPFARAATTLQQSNEAALASKGQSTGAELSRIRQEATRAIGGASLAGSEQLASENLQKVGDQRFEIEARKDVQAQGAARRRTSLFEGLAQAAGSQGQLAGSVPEVQRIAGVAGAPIRKPEALDEALSDRGVSPELRARLLQMDVAKLTRVAANLEAGIIGPEEEEMLAILADEAAGR